ncbi:hypothetical protein [Puia sp.]|uniref:hypothetical protein n=1 Tax=Puia sp. TaxID=2045100 RepID=UPI002F3E2B24
MTRIHLLCLPFALFFLLLSQQSQAQQTDPVGYYITLTHDTVAGSFPHYRETSHNPTTIAFLPGGASRPVQLSPGSCLVVSIDGADRWLAYQGKVLANPTSAAEQDGDGADRYTEGSVFVRELYNDGHFRLYELAGRQRENFFISGDTLRLQELYFKAFLEGGHFMESDEFRQQLLTLFVSQLEGNASLRHKLENVRYTETDLLKVFRVATGNRNARPHQKHPPRVFVGLGLSANFFRVGLEDPSVYAVKAPYTTNYSPVIQAGAEVPLGRGLERFFFSVALQAFSWKNTATQPNVGTESYKATEINLPLSLGYMLVRGPNVSLAVSAGLAPTLLMNNTQDISYQGSAIKSHASDGRFASTVFGGLELILGKKFAIATNYYIPFTVGDYSYYIPRQSVAQCCFRYIL